MPFAAKAYEQLQTLLKPYKTFIIACSGGIDSLLLSVMSHRIYPEECRVAHLVSPAVPPLATSRVKNYAQKEGWKLNILKSNEFEDADYLRNPVERCFYCKTKAYQAISAHYKNGHNGDGTFRILSGANLDDLGDYRPGLEAAKNFQVLHPYIELKIDKEEIRAIARELELDFSELPASPCLASRVYTGTPITAGILEAIDKGEEYVRQKLRLDVIRCRVRGNRMRIEVKGTDRKLIDETFLAEMRAFLTPLFPFIASIALDPEPYKSGRAFVHP